MEETNRQKKIGGVLQRDLADVIQQELKRNNLTGIIVSVSKVKVTTDLSIAKAYISIFPAKDAKGLLEELKSIAPQLKHQLAQRTKNQLRKMPDLNLYLDDSLEYIEKIEEAVKGEENPIENPDLLDKRKKS
ncbi:MULTISPECIES: 30S ribosome-binding factor RbfA [Mesonia]|uniref:30S ribosome-binding factor n=1 Tax=Mesonia oceanica TaxID=2687242 RepID=A0AC61Y424_9FLAO|nr:MULTISPECIES: 30S ribosome-binding factor RbfA [Mesonia]MAN28588.1 ribosome-binding factor A [Mesonia sp.]MAQ41269.1 ribosome-binding factor A [Mesonia sp.]MBJ97368.1 ribosome-binding factor A [Flavobacteriaceae bacterium]VVU98842.1 30S ribosome-binding factor [Mesonia oceanica]|tara:strand:+ start:519 stop:914 length:396 start_codon:yes stop_codon:yes gene_type:complete